MRARTAAVALVVAARRVGALRLAKSVDDLPVHAAADRHLPKIQVATLAAFNLGRRAWKATKDPKAAADAVRKALGQTLKPALLATMKSGGDQAIGKLRSNQVRALAPQRPGQPHSTSGPFKLQFNATDPNAVAWAEQHAAELAKGISDTTEQAIRDAVAEAMAGGGLDEAEDDILDAVGDASRAELIARTESMTAANEGQRQGWDQAIESGLLPKDTQIVWIATAGCCDDCDALDGATRDADGEYDDADVGDGPPLHPNCRCTEGIAG